MASQATRPCRGSALMNTVLINVTFGGPLVRYLPAGGKGNKRAIDIDNGDTLPALFEQLGFSGDERLLVILNGNVVQQEQFSDTVLNSGDALSLMPPIQAG